MPASREAVLLAIKRAAAENDGVPMGVERFERLTGIRRSEWEGRYWARWSDALIEAGFAANSWRVSTLTEEDLLSHLANLTRTLGRYPVTTDRKMYRRQNADFPDAKTFDNRLGGRAAQLSKLRDFSLSHDGFADVYEVIQPLIKDSDHSAEEGPLVVRGSVYLMKSGAHFKIGRSNHVGRRVYELAIQLPERLDLVHQIDTDDPEGIEHYWHRRFESKRANGEWFALSPADVAAFKRRKSYM